MIYSIEHQPFSLSYDLAPPHPLSSQHVGSLTQSSCVSPVGLTAGRERGRGWARSRIIRPLESLVLYKSFNTFQKRGPVEVKTLLIFMDTVPNFLYSN
jgi:hypothetical protein